MIFTEEQDMLADMVRPFLAEHAPVAHLRALRNRNDPTGFCKQLWCRFGELGLAGVIVGKDHGGMELGAVEAGIVLEEIGRNLTPSPFLGSAVGAATALGHGSETLARAWLPAIASGTAVLALAIDEGPHHRPLNIALKAERSGNGFRLSGAKTGVQHGHVADAVIVAARTSGAPGEENGLTLLVVRRDADGLSANPQRLVDASISSRLTFDGVVVDADAVLGKVDDGWPVLSRTLDMLRTGAAAELVGVASGAMDRTVAYLRDRKQFAVEIGTFQALQHRAAHLYSELEVARAATLKAQQLLDAGAADAHRAAMVAKAMAGLASALAVQESVQMHGGIGMTDAHDIGLYMKRDRVLSVSFGDADYHADQLARLARY